MKGLTSLGGATAILATAPDGKIMSPLIDGASIEPLSVRPDQFIMSSRSITGWPSNTTKDSEDTLHVCMLKGIRRDSRLVITMD